VRDVLDRFAATLRGELGDDVLAIRLFGSYARGTAGPDSDIDTLVIARTLDFARKKQILDVAGDLWIETGLLISPTVMDAALYARWVEQERPLAMAIEREGCPI
jgi:uncharacterized protein